MTQGVKFDPDAMYIRQYVPELASLPTKHIFAPWEAPADVLMRAKIKLGEDYPHPIVDLKQSRQRALDALQSIKKEVE